MASRRPRPTNATPDTSAVQDPPPLQSRPKALVFISHDSRDSDIAEAFATLLSDVSAGTLKSFRSSDKRGNAGIEFGAEWYTSIMSQLDDATDVVALLTARSIDRPWILYEAGVAKGKLETTVLGLALGVPLEKVSTGPFGQFQNCADDEDSLTKLVVQLLRRNPDAAPREEAVRMQVKLFIESLSKVLATKQKKPPTEPSPDEQGVAKLFEEVKAMVRELPERVDDRIRIASRRAQPKELRRLHPKMLDDLVYRASSFLGKRDPSMGMLVLLSFARDDNPSLYELGMEIYRAMRAGDRTLVAKVHKQFELIAEMMIHGPWGRDFMRDDEESFFSFRVLPDLVARLVREYLSGSTVRRRPIKANEPPTDASLA